MDEDIDGVPLEAEGDAEDGEGEGEGRGVAGFVPSRWESVEPAAPEPREPTPPPPDG